MRLAPRVVGGVVLEHVSKSFGGIEVLKDVDIRLPAGTITEIIGDNGAGKTSLLRILAGTLSPSAGEVLVSGSPPGRGLAALVPAGDRALYWRLTGRQELEFFARVTGLDLTEARQLAAAAAEALGIGRLMDQQIGTFSTGQRRRLMVARSLVGCAPVLLLDEPYADLDDSARGVVDAAVRGWVSEGGLALWTSPMSEGGPEPDSRFRLADGRLESE